MLHANIDRFLIDVLRFESSSFDPCVYARLKDNKALIIALYVDDLLLAGDDKGYISWVKRQLSKRFEMIDMGGAEICLGLEITRDCANRTLKLTQTSYATSILDGLGITKCRRVVTLLKSHLKSINSSAPLIRIFQSNEKLS